LLPDRPAVSGIVCWHPANLLVLWLVYQRKHQHFADQSTNKCR
jgi:hypothetical protein